MQHHHLGVEDRRAFLARGNNENSFSFCRNFSHNSASNISHQTSFFDSFELCCVTSVPWWKSYVKRLEMHGIRFTPQESSPTVCLLFIAAPLRQCGLFAPLPGLVEEDILNGAFCPSGANRDAMHMGNFRKHRQFNALRPLARVVHSLLSM